MRRELKLPFGIKDGILVEIDQVDGGEACNCFCPCCNNPLVARKGKQNVHHFSHASGEDCGGGLETAIHLAAKEILLKNKKMFLPAVGSMVKLDADYPLKYNKYHRYILAILSEPSIFTFDDVIVEKRLGSIVPDLVLIKNGVSLLVEIAVTHFIDDIKRDKIIKTGISTLQIDLRQKKSISMLELEEILLKGRAGDYERAQWDWIYNRRVENFNKIKHTIKLSDMFLLKEFLHKYNVKRVESIKVPLVQSNKTRRNEFFSPLLPYENIINKLSAHADFSQFRKPIHWLSWAYKDNL